QRNAKMVKAGNSEPVDDHRLMGEAAATSTILFRQRSAEEAVLPGGAPRLAADAAGLDPRFIGRRDLALEEGCKGIVEKPELLVHPGGGGNVQGRHVLSFRGHGGNLDH